MTSDQYTAACQREIEAAEKVCGKDAPQAQLVGHLAGELVRLRESNEALRRAYAREVAKTETEI